MRLIALLAALLPILTASCAGGPAQAACGQPGQWLAADPAAPTPLEAAALIDRMAQQQAVLLGEAHDSAEDHRWQLHTLAQLQGRQPRIAIGFEMFPRRLQGALDQWVAGKLSEREFLQRTEWDKVWGFAARDYLPLFHFARMHRIPMLALNVERELTEAVGKQGWDAVPESRKEGVSRPAAPTPEYLQELRTVFAHHPERDKNPQAFDRFVEAQTLWDRAMAEAVAAHLQREPDALVVAILGAGHVRQGHGLAHQLKALGVARVGALLTWPQDENCNTIPRGMADAVQIVRPPPGQPVRIGIAIAPGKGDGTGLHVDEVAAGSIAARAGLKAGDTIVAVAGRPARNLQQLRNAIQEQPPGTWLPLTVKRGEAEIEIVARFPAEP
jgi:uncharacterized iron-regulated protein